jgi:hypothetical protein
VDNWDSKLLLLLVDTKPLMYGIHTGWHVDCEGLADVLSHF